MLKENTIIVLNGFDDQDWLRNVPKVTINLPWCSFNQTFEGIFSILEFFERQATLWDEKSYTIPELQPSKLFFAKGTEFIVEFLTQQKNSSEAERKVSWHQIKTRIEDPRFNETCIFLADAPDTLFIEHVLQHSADEAIAAFKYITNTRIDDVRTPTVLSGAFKAFMFKNGYDEGLKTELGIEAIEKKAGLFDGFISESAAKLYEHLSAAEEQEKANHEAFQNSKATAEKDFDKWFNESKIHFSGLVDSSVKRHHEVDALYTEHMRLQAPTKYWKLRAARLRAEGRKYLCWFAILVILGASSLYFLLWYSPKEMLESIFSGDKATAVRWSIVFIVFLSFLAYGIRILAKITFSSFHLARDAEEREQLTYVYLALKKDCAVDEKDRTLILQSIFSRADTGLLKEDSAPTMPGNFMDKVLNKQ